MAGKSRDFVVDKDTGLSEVTPTRPMIDIASIQLSALDSSCIHIL
jgi:hypothetical protein